MELVIELCAVILANAITVYRVIVNIITVIQ